MPCTYLMISYIYMYSLDTWDPNMHYIQWNMPYIAICVHPLQEMIYLGYEV